MELNDLQLQVRAFAQGRDWEQFHLPRSLVLALMAELGELAELVQWSSDDAVTQEWIERRRDRLEEEVSDVFIYLVRLADVLDIDLADAAGRKLVANASKYPVSKARGNASKYTEFEDSP